MDCPRRGSCEKCGKKLYSSKRAAKMFAKRLHPGEHMSAYRCPSGGGFHIGHLPKVVMRGRATREDIYLKRESA